jgi:hypothetical protein
MIITKNEYHRSKKIPKMEVLPGTRLHEVGKFICSVFIGMDCFVEIDRFDFDSQILIFKATIPLNKPIYIGIHTSLFACPSEEALKEYVESQCNRKSKKLFFVTYR